MVFIHGFMGSPNQFADLAEAVQSLGGGTVSLLLPGHGAGMEELAKARACHWQNHVQKEIENIRAACKKIFLVGHSMGALLALNASLVKENRISGLVLIAAPLKVHLFHPRSLFRKLRLILFRKQHKVKAAYIQSNSLQTSGILSCLLAIRPMLEVYRLAKKTRKGLGEVSVPVYMFHSKKDETSAYKSAALLYAGLKNTERRLFPLEKSWHAFYDAEERKTIKKELLAFILHPTGQV